MTLTRRLLTYNSQSTLRLPRVRSAQLVYWFDPSARNWQDSARTTPALIDTDPVGAADEMSGNNRFALQTTAGKRPLLKLAQNSGLPVLRFDGVDDYLTFFGAGVPAGPVTGFAVLKPSGTGARTFLSGQGGNAFQWRVNAAGKQELVNSTVAVLGTGNAVVSTVAFSVLAVTWDNVSAVTFYLNGAADGAGSTASATASPVDEIGSRNGGVAEWFAGDLGPMLFYTGVMVLSEVLSVSRRLARKCGVLSA
jgi:hypothetical protein